MSSAKPPESHDGEERERRIAAYVVGDMSPDEAAAFEREMEAEAALRREVEQWRAAMDAGREWMEAPPPGVERIETMDARQLLGRDREAALRSARVIPFRRMVLRVAAAAAIFVAGLFIGQSMQRQTAGPPGSDTALPGARNGATTTPEHPAPSGDEPPRGVEPGRTVAQLPVGDRARDEGGRLVVETTLKQSGARVTMVIDGNFELAQASSQP